MTSTLLPEAPAGSPFRLHDSAFVDVLGDTPRLVQVAAVDAHEGPVYDAHADALYFTTLPRRQAEGTPLVAVKRIALDGCRFPVEPDQVTVVRADANAANGMTLDQGRLLVCEQGSLSTTARISRLDPVTGESRTVVDAWHGTPLNSPNDVVVGPDGAIWFTDPSYGSLQSFRPEPQAGDYVYRLDSTSGRLTVVVDSLDKPNGLAFSPDGSTLYIGDSGANQEPGSYYPSRPHHILAFDVRHGHLSGQRLFAVTTPGFPDGIKTDSEGRVYASSFDGVQVFDPAGDLIGEIALPGAVNFTFGGAERNVLFITSDTAVWAAVLNAKGA
jgi:gluconolactonase